MQDIKPSLTSDSELSLRNNGEFELCLKNISTTGHETCFKSNTKVEPSVKNLALSSVMKRDIKVDLCVKNFPNFRNVSPLNDIECGSFEEDEILNLENKLPPKKHEKFEIYVDVLNFKKELSLKDNDVPKILRKEDALILENDLSFKENGTCEIHLQNKISQEVLANNFKEVMPQFSHDWCSNSYTQFQNLKKHVEFPLCDNGMSEGESLVLESDLSLREVKQNNSSLQNKVPQKALIHGHLKHIFQLAPKAKKKWSCKFCGMSYNRNRDLQSHLYVHGDSQFEKKHQCSICHKKLCSKSSLKDHMLTHTGEKPWPCKICSFCTSQKSALKRHMRTHTGEKPYECNACLKKFALSNILKCHLRIHTREKAFICDVCKKAFWRKEALNEHYIIHSGERPYECDICGKVFKYNFRLKAHYNTHTQDRKFECEFCEMRFFTKLKWKEHSYSHTGEKPYLCTYNGCGKAFSKYSIRARHMMIHTGLQPYVCEICKRGFNQKTSLTRHYVVHTLEKPYSCEFCEQSFTQKSYLKFHIRKKHNESMIIKLEEIKSENSPSL